MGEADPPNQAAVRSSYEEVIHVTLWISVIMAVLSLLSSVFIIEKPLANKIDNNGGYSSSTVLVDKQDI